MLMVLLGELVVSETEDAWVGICRYGIIVIFVFLSERPAIVDVRRIPIRERA